MSCTPSHARSGGSHWPHTPCGSRSAEPTYLHDCTTFHITCGLMRASWTFLSYSVVPTKQLHPLVLTVFLHVFLRGMRPSGEMSFSQSQKSVLRAGAAEPSSASVLRDDCPWKSSTLLYFECRRRACIYKKSFLIRKNVRHPASFSVSFCPPLALGLYHPCLKEAENTTASPSDMTHKQLFFSHFWRL